MEQSPWTLLNGGFVLVSCSLKLQGAVSPTLQKVTVQLFSVAVVWNSDRFCWGAASRGKGESVV
jgi:hypothetical protein